MGRRYICKIHTDRLRKLDIKRLQKAERHVTSLPHDDWESGGHVVQKLVQALEDEKLWRFNAERSTSAFDRERYHRFADQSATDARKLEHRIWDTQAATGCKIPEYEHVARDADREGQRSTAETIRRQRGIGRRRR